MAYGDLPIGAAHKPNKGHEGGACNRERCQAEPALYWNHGSYSWYCADCARDIGEDPVNKRGWDRDWLPRVGHPQFETREEMDAREGEHSVSVPARQQGKTVVVENARLHYESLQPPAMASEGERRWTAIIPRYPNRQQRRAAERAAFKRLPKRS